MRIDFVGQLYPSRLSNTSAFLLGIDWIRRKVSLVLRQSVAYLFPSDAVNFSPWQFVTTSLPSFFKRCFNLRQYALGSIELDSDRTLQTSFSLFYISWATGKLFLINFYDFAVETASAFKDIMRTGGGFYINHSLGGIENDGNRLLLGSDNSRIRV